MKLFPVKQFYGKQKGEDIEEDVYINLNHVVYIAPYEFGISIYLIEICGRGKVNTRESMESLIKRISEFTF